MPTRPDPRVHENVLIELLDRADCIEGENPRPADNVRLGVDLMRSGIRPWGVVLTDVMDEMLVMEDIWLDKDNEQQFRETEAFLNGKPAKVFTTLHAAREQAAQRFLAIAEKLKAEAGVKQHVIVKGLYGRAWSKRGLIHAPQGKTRKQLYILAHECAHIALKHQGSSKPKHVVELEAEKYAHEALRRHGVPVPRSMTIRAKQYVAHKIRQAEKRGAKNIDPAARKYAFA